MFRIVLALIATGSICARGKSANRCRRGIFLERPFFISPDETGAANRSVPHDVEAVEDSAFLLTMSWHGR
jgi:hypothetical protein